MIRATVHGGHSRIDVDILGPAGDHDKNYIGNGFKPFSSDPAGHCLGCVCCGK